MKNTILNFLRGRFLIDRKAPKNWRFILFLSALSGFMIASSHRVDRMAFRVGELNEDIKKLKSTFATTRTQLQKMKIESEISKKLKKSGLKPCSNPPKKIRIQNKL